MLVYTTRLVFVAAVIAVVTGLVLTRSAQAEDPVATVVLTYSMSEYDLYDVFEEDFDENGWAHITDDGNDIWVTITGGDVGDIPPKDTGESYCECWDGPCHIRVLCVDCPMTCSVSSPGVCYCSDSC